jgi:hypothetical protein
MELYNPIDKKQVLILSWLHILEFDIVFSWDRTTAAGEISEQVSCKNISPLPEFINLIKE